MSIVAHGLGRGTYAGALVAFGYGRAAAVYVEPSWDVPTVAIGADLSTSVYGDGPATHAVGAVRLTVLSGSSVGTSAFGVVSVARVSGQSVVTIARET